MYRKGPKGWLKHADFIILDLLCLQAAFVLSYALRHGFGNPYNSSLYRDMAIFIEFADIAVIFFYESFKNVLKRGYYKEFSQTIKHTVILWLLATAYLFITHGSSAYSRISLVSMAFIYVALSYFVRILWKKFLLLKMKSAGSRSLLIVTERALAPSIIASFKNKNYEGYRIAGLALVDAELIGQSVSGVPVVADAKSAPDFLLSEWVDEVFASFSRSGYKKELLDKIAETGVVLHISIDLTADMPGRAQILEKIGDFTVLTTTLNYASLRQLFLKRALDIVGGAVGCFITLILTILLTPIICLQSPGSPFFSQYRVGRNGKLFRMFKFRSMYKDAEQRKNELLSENRCGNGLMFKLEFDPRIIGNKLLPDGTKKTGVGHFIRETSLDEFPQFFNVLKGDMSLVGTRPPTLDEWEKYELRHRQRLAIKPGITGLWQVSGRSDITDFEEVVKLDTDYIKNWSLGLDIKILLKTIAVVVTKKGAL